MRGKTRGGGVHSSPQEVHESPKERERCLRETGKAPIKTGWAETDKGQPGKPNVRARWVAKEYKIHARPELHASTPPVEALKVEMSEVATGECGGKVVALAGVRRAYFYPPSRRRVFVELPPEDSQVCDEHMCGLLQYSLYGKRDTAQNWEEELKSTLSDLKFTRGIACPCVWQGCINGEHVVATGHGDDITIGGTRSAVEFLIKMISRKYEIEKQVIGEDADLEKSGNILNRVIEWCRDVITIEADQIHVSEILKDLELERANHTATPCTVERKKDGNARSDESEGGNQCEHGQYKTKHEWDNVGDGGDKNRVQMINDERDDANDSQALTGGEITKYRALVARISYLSHDRI